MYTIQDPFAPVVLMWGFFLFALVGTGLYAWGYAAYKQAYPRGAEQMRKMALEKIREARDARKSWDDIEHMIRCLPAPEMPGD